VRFGLVGTGHWARVTHAPALASTEGIEFAAVWGRSPEAAGKLAAAHQVTPYEDLDAFLSDVDAVAFAVPPDVQAPIAARAAGLGKHLLLEKPIATTDQDADALTAAVDRAQVASVVFFTARFQPEIRDWLASAGKQQGWKGGAATWLGTALQVSSPYNTPWRNDKGGLWDIGPHMVALLWAVLGPVQSVTADAGAADVTHLVLHHENGTTSTITATLSAPPAAAVAELFLWGEHGRSAAPMKSVTALPALRIALAELAGNVASGRVSHPCDVRFGRCVNRVLTEAQCQLNPEPAKPGAS
jgi:predicted dehydrogenase